MSRLKKTGRLAVDSIEVYLPIALFILLFLAFLTNVFFRYVLRDPQNWTFEFCVYSFVVIGLLGASAAYRKDDHVVFDLVYNKLSPRGQNVFRLIGSAIVAVCFVAALPTCTLYIMELPSKTSIMGIPEQAFFVSLIILMVSTVIRFVYYFVLDVKAFRSRTYVQTYHTDRTETDALI
jgi:TRAP-type C4-dicarboxylate transport system permease small subunit